MYPIDVQRSEVVSSLAYVTIDADTFCAHPEPDHKAQIVNAVCIIIGNN